MLDPPARHEMLSPDVYFEISRFLFREAALLDGDQVRSWLEEIVHPEVIYQVPIRTTRERGGDAIFSERGFHLSETYGTLETRVRRLETEYAWAEDPPSRTRRFVTNVIADPSSDDDACWNVSSNLLIFRSRYDSTEYVLLSCLRQDLVRRVGDDLRLTKRTILMDHTTLPVHNLGIFL